MKKTINIFICLLVILLFACANQTIKNDSGSKIPNQKNIYSSPNRDPGIYQSPINILSSDTIQTKDPHIFSIHFEDKVTEVENLGHTIQLDFKAGSTITIDTSNYTFKQMHFHTPAEHLIDGVTYPMELHIVGVNNDNPDVSHYVVVGVLFKMGTENEFINEFLNAVPQHEHDKTMVKVNTIKLKNLLSKSDLPHHYHYKGSLTTPPYTETVNWFLLKRIFEASPKQIQIINSIEGNNARHIEPKNNRLIENN
jgi:carbonic anhydrase